MTDLVSRANGEVDRSLLLFLRRDRDAGEARHTIEVHPARREVSTRNRDCLDRLVDGARPDHVDLGRPVFANAIRDRARGRARIRVR